MSAETPAEGLPAGGNAERQRIGLALSGGGFRAAFFHIGVLGRLAEAGILPKIEVISTISGGSIVGAAYYMRLRDLLEENEQDQLDPGKYVDLVNQLHLDMREAVRQRIRWKVFLTPKVFLMALPVLPNGRRYSRTDQLGDLLDRHLYKGLWRGPIAKRSFGREQQIELRDLKISPGREPLAGDPSDYNENPDVKFKVPELVVNATCLNTGHLWRFEVVRMGEHAEPDPEGGDANRALVAGYFPDHDGVYPVGRPELRNQDDFPVAHAVAASAAFPGLFAPLPITGIYEGARINLVDGGVADNQGIQALRDHQCTWMIVSDGSGQMEDKAKPSGYLPSVIGRVTSVQSDRIRDLEFLADDEYVKLIHLRDGLEAPPVNPGDPWDEPGEPPLPPEPDPSILPLEPEPIDPDALDAISRIRTDLDGFTDNEIGAVEYCGYLHTDRQLRAGEWPAGLDTPIGVQLDLGYTDDLVDQLVAGDPDLKKELANGRNRFLRALKGWRAPLFWIVRGVVGILLVAAVLWFIVTNWIDWQVIVILAVTAWFAIAWVAFLIWSKVIKPLLKTAEPDG